MTEVTIKRVRTEVTGGIAHVTLNQPDVLNAFDRDTAEDMVAAFEAVLGDPQVRVVIVTGEGRGFCAGANLKFLAQCFADEHTDEAHALLEAGDKLVRLIRGATTPVIAAINGLAAGGGAGLALACDVRLAADTAKIGFVFSNIGLTPDWGTSHLLPRLVGPARALELFWSGAWIEADEAARLGLFNRVVPAASLAAAAQDFATQLAAKPADVLAAVKQAMNASESRTLEDSLRWEVTTQQRMFATGDARKAIETFGGRGR